MAKTYEEMLAELLNSGAPNAAGGSGGYSGPGATTGPVGQPDYSLYAPKTPTMGYSGPGMTTGPVEPSKGTGGYGGPGATTAPVAPWTPPTWNTGGRVGPLSSGGWDLATSTPLKPIDPNAPGYSGPGATTGPVAPPQKPGGELGYSGPGATTNTLNPYHDATTGPVSPGGYSGPPATTGPVGGDLASILQQTLGATPKTGQQGYTGPGATSNRQRTDGAARVAQLFQQLLGRAPTQAELGQYGNDIDDNYLSAIARSLSDTEEARQYVLRQQEGGSDQSAPPVAGAPSTDNWENPNADTIRRYFNSRGVNPSEESVSYWLSKWPELNARGREIGNPGYAQMRLSMADELGGGYGGGSGGEFSDRWGSQLEGDVGRYGPAARERAEALARTYRTRASELNQPAFTSGDEAVLRAKAFDQLERRRQETLKNDREGVYARGFAPTSGLVRDATNRTNENFEGARTGIESNLLQAQMSETQRRRDAAVQLEALATQALNGGDLSAIEALGLPLSLMQNRQNSAASLLNNSGSQGMNQILQILAMLQNQQGYNNQQSGSQAGGWGALIPLLLQALG